jgi:hypothetical protein
MTEPIDEVHSDAMESGEASEADPAGTDFNRSSATQPEETRDSAKIERLLWVFISICVVVSLVVLVLSWRTGMDPAATADSTVEASSEAGGEAGAPGSEYALRAVTTSQRSVHSEPRPDAPVIDELGVGQLVRVRLDGGDWLPAVREDGQIIGWLEAAHLGPASPDGALFTADLERLSGGVAGQLPADIPRVTVRLSEEVEVGAPVGSVVYWYESGACTYALELLERADGLMKTAQVPESSSCDTLGDIWFVDGETAMTVIWHRLDGSQWFSSYLTLD